MTRRRHTPSVPRLLAVVGVAAALVGTGATASQALTLPDPVATAVGGASTTVGGVVGGLGLPVPGATGPAPTGTGSSTSSGTSGGATGSTPSATSSPARSSSTPSAGSGTTSSQTTGSRPASNGAVVDSPAVTACLIPSGGSSPAVEVDLRAAGVDLSSPLVKQFPQALAPCPKGAVPAGDHLAAADASVQGLLGACVRVTRQVVPVQTTLVVLDHDVIKELTAAGVPLQQLVVPCPAGSGAPGSGGSPSGPAAGHPAAGDRPGAASALPSRLAFTGGAVLPPVGVGAVLLWLGLWMTRRARALSAG